MQREIRYIVIKRKHLTDGHERHLLGYLADIGVDTIESVVVEHDWPEYEAVWDMIEARVDGKPGRIATLEAQLAEAREALQTAERVLLWAERRMLCEEYANIIQNDARNLTATLAKIGGGA